MSGRLSASRHPEAAKNKPPHRIKVLLTAAGVMIENPMPGVEVEVRDYDVPDAADWNDQNVGRDSDGDRFQFLLFDDKGEHVLDAKPPDEYEGDDDEDDENPGPSDEDDDESPGDE